MTATASTSAESPSVDIRTLQRELDDTVDGEVRFDEEARGAYATDASNYRQPPIGVVLPRTIDDGVRAVEVCRRHRVPVLSRGGGTSLGGQCTNTAVVIDWSKYCHRLVSVDPANRTCVVEPGIVLDELNRSLAEYDLAFGPKPSTHSHCTIGGMVGNNSCGASAQRYGKTVDNVRRLEILTYDGLRCWVGQTGEGEFEGVIAAGGRKGALYGGLRDIRDRYRDEIRRQYPDIPRRVSGYNLDSLLAEPGPNLARLLVGSEGTLATVLRAEVDLVPTVSRTALLVLGYSDLPTAADTVPELLTRAEPLQLEAIDGRLVHFMREQGMFAESVALLPKGESWLFLQFGGATTQEADEQVHSLLSALGKDRSDEDVAVSDNPEREQQMLKAREAGLGATAHPPDMPASWPGWEDSAVHPERLGGYLRDLLELFSEFGYERPALYGHFGQGCVHGRIPFRLESGPGIVQFRRFVRRAADLVASHGGSLSGEHGDGQARGELLVRIFGGDLVRAFAETKTLFDPDNRMNPGKAVAPFRDPDEGRILRVDEKLRLGVDYRPREPSTELGYPDDGGSFQNAVLRCVGIGNCRSHDGGVMCPSYRATGDEEHSTRGRARLLFEMMSGHDDSPISDGWRSEAVKDALDLCLACKGCKSDCPTGVDMAAYKAEFLAQHYKHRPRPVAHYSLGWLPALAQAAHITPAASSTLNALLHAPGLAGAAKWLGGITPEREIPRFAPSTFREQWRLRDGREPLPGDPHTVVLWPDTFTNHFDPRIAVAAVRVLERAGFRVAVPRAPACCGLTWISTGQLATARRVLRRTFRVLRPWLRTGTPIVVLEPSCAAVFRSDMRDLMPHDEDAQRLRSQVATLAETLTGTLAGTLEGPRSTEAGGAQREDDAAAASRADDTTARQAKAIVQTHCHQHAVLGFEADTTVLSGAGIDAEVLDSGCCGLAGNFGFERGHYEVSMACAEHGLLPAVRQADPETWIVADGFSCRTQVAHGSGRRALHLAQALDAVGSPGVAEAADAGRAQGTEAKGGHS